MKTWKQILERKEKRRQELETTLPRIVEQLKALGALQVILCGSLARGDTGLGSDLDLIAIMPSSMNSREWLRTIYAAVDRGIACDILAYTEKEVEAMLPISSFLRLAMQEGR